MRGGNPPGHAELTRLGGSSRKGRTDRVVQSSVFAPCLSPDGQRIAYPTLGMKRHVWVYDLNRGTATKLTSDGMASFVAWTPDGRRVVFGWGKTGDPNIYWQPVDGSSPMERLTQSSTTSFRIVVSGWRNAGTGGRSIRRPVRIFSSLMSVTVRSRRF